MEQEIVCDICGAPVAFRETEGVWRHSGRPMDDNSQFCDRYGYPVRPKVLQPGERIEPFTIQNSPEGIVITPKR